MAGKWVLRVEGEPAKPGAYSVHLGWEDAKCGQLVELVAPCNSIDTFRQEIDRVVEELQQLAVEARRQAESFERARAAGPELNPAKVWQQMDGLPTEAEMFELFNGLDELQRQQVAEYIFTHVNMFKGRGPVFSQHYDATSHFLE